jgi:hypothetical protein
MWRSEDRLDRLERQIERLADAVVRLDARLDGIATDTTKMANHVNFVERVYASVKRPFFFLMGAVDRVSAPPRIEDAAAERAASGRAESGASGASYDDRFADEYVAGTRRLP